MSEQPQPFPRSFWAANVTELFERGAYYSMASLMVPYLGQLGLGKYWPSTLNGSVLWFLLYFLPILSGSIADQVGFRRALLWAFILLGGAYFLMGSPVWVGGALLNEQFTQEVVAGAGVILPAVVGLLLIGIGGSIVKPCIAGTVQKTSGKRATLGFGIFYMVINIGSLFGRSLGYLARKRFGLSAIFGVAMACAGAAFLTVSLLYRDPEKEAGGAAAPQKPRRSVGRILIDMVSVLKSGRFTLFLVVSAGFTVIYNQVYNLLTALYLKQVVEIDAPIDLYTMANPFVIVFFQLAVTRLFGKMKPIRSMVVGSIIVGVAMGINLIPVYAEGGVRAASLFGLPLASLFIIFTVALVAFGELFTSARTYEYIGALAPQGQEGLFLGYANLPIAIGSFVGGPVGAAIFNEVMAKNAVKLPNGLLELQPAQNALGWVILMAIGFGSALLMWLYDRWLQRQVAASAATR